MSNCCRVLCDAETFKAPSPPVILAVTSIFNLQFKAIVTLSDDLIWDRDTENLLTQYLIEMMVRFLQYFAV